MGTVLHLSDRFDRATPDALWIDELSDEGNWVVVSQDHLRKNDAEREALRRSGLMTRSTPSTRSSRARSGRPGGRSTRRGTGATFRPVRIDQHAALAALVVLIRPALIALDTALRLTSRRRAYSAAEIVLEVMPYGKKCILNAVAYTREATRDAYDIGR